MNSEVPKNPVLFMKPSTAIVIDGEPITIPGICLEMHHEVELVVAIGTRCKHVPAREAFGHVLGYGVGLDMTLRDIQSEAKKKGLPWTISKGFDTSAPVSEIISADLVGNPHELTISCSVNGQLRQSSSTSAMVFTIDKIIEYASSIFTLEKGDLIFTGTPEGVGPVRAGDLIEAELAGLTRTHHTIVSA